MKQTLNMGMTDIPIPMMLQKLRECKTKTSKKKYIKKLWDFDAEELFLGLELSMDNGIDFGTKSAPLWDDSDDGMVTLDFNKFYDLCMLIKYKKINKSLVPEKILELANEAGTDEWNNFYRLIILKKFHTTMPLKEIEEVLKEIKEERMKKIGNDTSVVLSRRK